MSAFSSLLKTAFSGGDMNASVNGTTEIIASIPASILEAFLPGYGGVTRFIHQSFGFDITIFVSVGVVIWLFCIVGSYLYSTLGRLVANNYMCSINISSLDDIYVHLLKWLAAQDSIKKSRSLMAETVFTKAWDGEVEESDDPSLDDDDEDDQRSFLNFSNQETKAPPRYIPHFGSHRFRWQGNFFFLQRAQMAMLDLGSMPAYKDQETLTLTCFGRSAQPIKNLLQVAKDFYLLDRSEKTVIRRPSSKEMRRYGGRHCWIQIADRPCRPMETVVLDHARKHEVLTDINEYLHPATPRWYANRGIPYRRGYLFHGPPGTGKTSLSFALAGVFGLDIYVISLLEPTLTEEDLGQLFTALPRRCVVLLEDIDTAGLVRPDHKNSELIEETVEGNAGPVPQAVKAAKAAEAGVVDLVKALKKANEETEEDKKKGISLSGLLNAIDGVASHEGRVLVMTTNKPEALDAALIRPGRVDLQVAFTNATQEQIKELFERMYTSVTPAKKMTASPMKSPGRCLPSFSSLLRLGSSKTMVTTTTADLHGGEATLHPTDHDGPIIVPSSPETTCSDLKNKAYTPPPTPTKESHYSPTPSPSTSPSPPPLRFNLSLETPHPDSGAVPKGKKARPAVAASDLKEIAASFAAKIPDGMFSPAEIQGFLLKRKRDPRRAAGEIERWVLAMRELRRSRTKVLDVQ